MKFTQFALIVSMSALVAACGNLSNVSPEGTADVDKLVWPKVEDASFGLFHEQKGTWPNWDNVRMIERGMTKPQLYKLIGEPHFAEGIAGVREWDYVFHYREQGQHKICQFKILFDKNYTAQSFFWKPNGCNGFANYTLQSDVLFAFDKDELSAEGQATVQKLANELKDLKAKHLQVNGFTDRLGKESYNLALSQRRAEAVVAMLKAQGITIPMTATGYGASQAIKMCEGESGQALRDCLKPNRRVEIKVDGIYQSSSDSSEAGTQGPSVLYDSQYPYPPKK